jgi:hypothetical protein
MDTKEFKSRFNDNLTGCVDDLTETLITHCQNGLISVRECMLQLDGVRFCEKAIRDKTNSININK